LQLYARSNYSDCVGSCVRPVEFPLGMAAPGRLLLGMQLNAQFSFDPSAQTEVEITFAPTGSTLIS
jgi:hypothetical protein